MIGYLLLLWIRSYRVCLPLTTIVTPTNCECVLLSTRCLNTVVQSSNMVRPVPCTPVRCDLRRLLERNSARNAADLQVLVGQTRESCKRGSPTLNEAEFSVGQSEQRPKSELKARVPGDRLSPDSRSLLRWPIEFGPPSRHGRKFTPRKHA